MEPLNVFIDRLKKIGIDVTLVGNYPWIYIDTINDVKVTEKFHSNHGFTIAFIELNTDSKIKFTELDKIFEIIRKYTK
jgi:hypothetical protein